MVLKMFGHSVIMLGPTVGLTFLLPLNGDQAVTVWLAFTGAALLADWLLFTPAQPKPSVLDLFERID